MSYKMPGQQALAGWVRRESAPVLYGPYSTDQACHQVIAMSRLIIGERDMIRTELGKKRHTEFAEDGAHREHGGMGKVP